MKKKKQTYRNDSIYRPGPASYPDVSLLIKMCAQRKAGRRQRLYPSNGPLRFITNHSFRARLCHAKNEAPEEEADQGRLFAFGASRKGAYSGQGAYFFFEKQPNVQKKL